VIEKALARLITDRIIVLSEQQRREINEEFGVGRAKQFSVIPLGLDTDEFADWRERGGSFRDELGVSRNAVLVGIVGRLTEIKNHELFLRVIADFKARFLPTPKVAAVKFVVIGDGSLRKSLEEQANSLGLADDVVFVGSRRDIANFYPALDIVALTSLNEGTPLTLIEAMANARPVISTAVGGVVDLLGEPLLSETGESFQICERGLRVPANDATAFAAGLRRLVEDSDLRQALGERGLVFVQRNYSKERLLENVRALYADLLAGKMTSVNAHSPENRIESRI
jgi:glycosyltransferase involved in cell wall biosynthesis